MKPTGQVVVVTGAGSGIGRALAIAFTGDGAQVVGCDKDEQGLSATVELCDAGMLAVPTDVTQQKDVVRLVDTAVTQFGRIDVLINNAGIANQGNLVGRPFADWQAVIDVNLNGLARCIHAILPGMLERNAGRIVNVSSREGETPRRTLSAYSASKAGVTVLTKALAREVAKAECDNVLINALIPGGTRTNMNRNDAMQDPEAVYPHTKYIVDLPAGGPSGRIFFRSEDYPMFTTFNSN